MTKPKKTTRAKTETMKTKTKPELKEAAPEGERFKRPSDRIKAFGFEVTTGTLLHVYPEELTLVTDEEHFLYDPRVRNKLREEFVEDILQNGVIKPVEIREAMVGETLRLEIVTGRQRTMHAIEANIRRVGEGQEKKKIPAILVKGEPSELILRMLSENAHTESETKYSRAYKVKRALDEGATKDSIRKSLGCAPNTIDQMLDFLQLAPEAREMIENGNIPLSALPNLASLDAEGVKEVVVNAIVNETTKAHQIAQLVSQKKEGKMLAADAKATAPKKRLSSTQIGHWMVELKSAADEGDDSALGAYIALAFVVGSVDVLSIKGADAIRQAAKRAGVDNYFAATRHKRVSREERVSDDEDDAFEADVVNF
jgi:ParB/RepB/Spo0J family partition protein